MNSAKQLLNTSLYSDWNSYFAIESSKSLVDLQPGDVIKLNINGMTFHPVIVVGAVNNTPNMCKD
jgi:hypothetical protein